jgi:hypothetical protein
VSFIHKIDHLFRTLPPHLSYELVGGYNSILRHFMSNLLFDNDSSLNNNSSLTDLTWQQLQLNIQDGGIGIGITDHLRFASYLSSFVHCSPSIFSHHTRITPGFSYDDLITHHSPDLYDDFCRRLRLLPTPDASNSSLLAIRTWQLHYNRTFMNTHSILNSVYYCLYHINKPNFDIPNLFITSITNNKLQHEFIELRIIQLGETKVIAKRVLLEIKSEKHDMLHYHR